MVAWNRNFKIRSQGCFFVSPRWGNLTKRVLNAIGPLSWTRLFPLLGKAHPKWWHETEIVKFDPKAVFSLRPDGESWKNAFWTEFDDLRYPSVLRCLEKPTTHIEDEGSGRKKNKIFNKAFFLVSLGSHCSPRFTKKKALLNILFFFLPEPSSSMCVVVFEWK